MARLVASRRMTLSRRLVAWPLRPYPSLGPVRQRQEGRRRIFTFSRYLYKTFSALWRKKYKYFFRRISPSDLHNILKVVD